MCHEDALLSERSLKFLEEVKGYLRSPEMKLGKPWKLLVSTISQDRNDGHISYLSTWKNAVFFGGRQRSTEVKNQHLENMLSQIRKSGYFSYSVYDFIMLKGKALLFW